MPVLVIELSVEPKTAKDRTRLAVALDALKLSDPMFDFARDVESSQTIIKGASEEHLEALVDRLKREFRVTAEFGAPQVAYRETITKRAEVTYTHKLVMRGSGQYAKVSLIFEPLPPGGGFEFANEVVADTIPKEYIPGVEKGIAGVRDTGILAGFQIIDFKVTLVDGAYHDIDSSVLAFEIAARAAFREAKPKLGMQLLEPVMRVEVLTPEEFIGDLMGDFNGRRGQVQGTGQRGNAQVIEAMVPLANMFGYALTLKSMTQGRGAYSMEFDRYQPVSMPPEDDNFPPAVGMRA